MLLQGLVVGTPVASCNETKRSIAFGIVLPPVKNLGKKYRENYA